jgi:Predicted nucleic acid-binding protein, contains PIN domain
MTYVIDASVAAKWFIAEPLRTEACRFLDYRERLHAPDLLVTEVASIAWKRVRRNEISTDQARTMVMIVRCYIPNLHASSDLVDTALTIAIELRHPIYDCLYLACLERSPDAVLITADTRLHGRTIDSRFRARVRHLRDIAVLD